MILLDTHVVAWLAYEPERLSKAATIAITNARQKDGLAVSDKTLWELAMMVSRRRLDFIVELRELLNSVEHHCQVLPITAGIAERSVRFSSAFSKDPSDRIIAATAIVHEMKLVTADDLIRKSGEVDCIW